LQELQFFFDNVQLCRGVEPDYWCHFCEEKLDSSQNQTVCFLVFKHLASNAHRKRVEEFCQATGVSATKPLDNFCIPRPRLQKYLRAASQLVKTSNSPPVLSAEFFAHTTAVNHDCAPLPVSDTTASDQKLALETAPPRVYRTVISSRGIIQNPTGVHEGKRVWGGGIIKYRDPADWLPWPIDLDVDRETISLRSAAAVAVAVAAENVFTGAKPPWEMNEEEERQYLLEADSDHHARKRATVEDEDGWLPKFKPVFGEQTRAKSRSQFQRIHTTTKKK